MEREIFRALVKALEKFTDDDGEVVFHGNRFRRMNESHTALLDVYFPWLKSRRYWTVPWDLLNEASKRRFKYIDVERVTRKRLHLRTHHDYEGEKTVKVPIEAYDLRKAPKTPKLPKIDLEAKVSYLDESFPEVFKIAKDMNASRIQFRVEEKQPKGSRFNIVLEAGDDFHEDRYERVYDHVDYIGPDGTQAVYSVDLLGQVAPLLKHAYPRTLSFGADKPLRLAMDLWTPMTATYYVAPRIEA